jgi:hypothetical protein
MFHDKGSWICGQAENRARPGPKPATARQAPGRRLVSDSAGAWAAEQQRQPSDLGLRVTLLTTAAPVTDARRRGGSDFALPLRERAGAA